MAFSSITFLKKCAILGRFEEKWAIVNFLLDFLDRLCYSALSNFIGHNMLDFFTERLRLFKKHETDLKKAITNPINRQQKLFYLPKPITTELTDFINTIRSEWDKRELNYRQRLFEWAQDNVSNPSQGTLDARQRGQDISIPEPQKPVISIVTYVDGKQVSEIEL